MTVWFGSDFHFKHKNIIGLCNRPFSNIEEMGTSFLETIKYKVKKEDTLYLLGDIDFSNHPEIIPEILSQYCGNLHLIAGNHDNKKIRESPYWSTVSDYKEIKINNQLLVLCHFPIESWKNMSHDSIHLHGHTHGNISHSISYKDNRLDIGYDSTREVLVSYEDVLKIIRSRKLANRLSRIEYV